MNTGLAELDFGAFPGDGNAEKVVTGEVDILSGSVLQVWVEPKDTADHTIDEHIIEPPLVSAGAIVAGVGFTIYGAALDELAYGKWNIRWVWA